MSIFNWIRAVAAAELSPGCKAFCLELIPHLNSKTLETHLGPHASLARSQLHCHR